MVRQNISKFLQCGRIFDKDGRGVESEPKAKKRDASCADVPVTQRKTARSVKVTARARAKERQEVPLTRTVPPSSRVNVATLARKATNGWTAGSVWQTLGDTRDFDQAGICGSSSDDDSGVDTSLKHGFCVEGNMMSVHDELLPLDSACEEHTCPWQFWSFECAVVKREWCFRFLQARK